VLSAEDWAEIRRLHRAEQAPIKAIARVTGQVIGSDPDCLPLVACN
jgi:hypothetical protein